MLISRRTSILILFITPILFGSFDRAYCQVRQHSLECVIYDQSNPVTQPDRNIHSLIDKFFVFSPKDTCKGEFRQDYMIDSSGVYMQTASLYLDNCNKIHPFLDSRELVFDQLKRFDTLNIVAWNDSALLRIKKRNGRFLPYKLTRNNANDSARWEFNFREATCDEKMATGNWKVEMLRDSILALNKLVRQKDDEKQTILDEIEQKKKEAWENRVVDYRDIDTAVTFLSVELFNRLCKEKYESAFLDPDSTVSDHYIMNEYFFLTVNRSGEVISITDERTGTNNNTHLLTGNDIETMRSFRFSVATQRDTSVMVRIPVGIYVEAKRTSYTVRLKKDKIRWYREPWFVDYVDEAHPHYQLIRDNLSQQPDSSGKYQVEIIDVIQGLYGMEQEEYNPFAEKQHTFLDGTACYIFQFEAAEKKNVSQDPSGK